MRVENVHGIDDHGRVSGVFALRVAELLDGRDGVFEQGVLPLGVHRKRPVAVDALIGYGSVLRKLVHDGLDVFRRNVVGVYEQRESLL